MPFIFYFLAFFLSYTTLNASPFESTKDIPVAFQSRFRSLDSSSRLWLYDIYHRQSLKNSDISLFNTTGPSSLEIAWKLHFLGHQTFDESPLFWMHYATLKTLLNLPNKSERFDFQTLSKNLYENEQLNLAVICPLLTYTYSKDYLSSSNRSKNEKIELTGLSKGLWLTLKGEAITVISTPSFPPWNYLKAQMVIEPEGRMNLSLYEKKYKHLADEITQLLITLHDYMTIKGAEEINRDYEKHYLSLINSELDSKEITKKLELHRSTIMRLQEAGQTMKMLPAKFLKGEWLSLHALKIRAYNPTTKQLEFVKNFTLFSNDDFEKIRAAYLTFEKETLQFYSKKNNEESVLEAATFFTDTYKNAYNSIVNTPYKEANGKKLYYPSPLRLEAETFYYRFPLIDLAIAAYFISLFVFLAAYVLKNEKLNHYGFILLLVGFVLHTSILILRCYVLQRPPVSNMFETVVYVPWVAIIIGIIFYFTTPLKMILSAACMGSLTLLILLKLTHVDARLENVQAVLDSQYWLIIHVLMVVGSYGAFVVCGILGHFYLIAYALPKTEITTCQFIARSILYTMYVGVALLIPGTILGGIWAAESWGRFWDWDPKESWAFISACVYLLVIHAYTFLRIRDLGLAIGSIVGLIAISFTWYGVNFILGTGLHSYGFGKGGENYYFGYIALEIVFILSLVIASNQNKLKQER